MKRNQGIGLRILVGASMLIVIAFAIANGRFVFAQSTDEAAVRETLLKSASSFAKNDTAEATKVWVNDESLTIFESGHANYGVGSSRVDLQACKLEYSIVSPK